MTRVLCLGLIAFAVFGAAAPPVRAQPAPPVPQVTITGFIDTVTSWSKNLNDSLVHRTGEREWYARNRGRFDMIGQLGQGQGRVRVRDRLSVGHDGHRRQDNNLAAGGVGTGQHNGALSAFDLNTDTQGSIEVKWLYTEFLLSMIPFPIIARVGAQPFAAQYKQAAYAAGDFAGVHLDFFINLNLKAHFTYAAIEENLTGSRRSLGFGRGDDWAVIASVEVTPFKGLDMMPLYSFLSATGSMPPSPRNTVGGIGGNPSFNRKAIGGVGGLGMYENRHTVGVAPAGARAPSRSTPRSSTSSATATPTTRSARPSTPTCGTPTSARGSST